MNSGGAMGTGTNHAKPIKDFDPASFLAELRRRIEKGEMEGWKGSDWGCSRCNDWGWARHIMGCPKCKGCLDDIEVLMIPIYAKKEGKSSP